MVFPYSFILDFKYLYNKKIMGESTALFVAFGLHRLS